MQKVFYKTFDFLEKYELNGLRYLSTVWTTYDLVNWANHSKYEKNSARDVLLLGSHLHSVTFVKKVLVMKASQNWNLKPLKMLLIFITFSGIRDLLQQEFKLARMMNAQLRDRAPNVIKKAIHIIKNHCIYQILFFLFVKSNLFIFSLSKN